MRVHSDRGRAESFGAVADAYDRARPGYPAELFADLIGLARPTTALDVGCGTGQLARALMARGLSVLGLEIDPQMAAVARRHGVPVEVSAFETWDPGGRTFDLIVCGQAWHWIDPVRGPRAAAAALPSGGLLALVWNYGRVEPVLRSALDAIYAELAPELADSSVRTGATETIEAIRADLAASGWFGAVERREYPWLQRYSADGYAALLTTHSDHRQLPARRLRQLVDAVRATCRRYGGPVVTHYRCDALLTSRVGPQ